MVSGIDELLKGAVDEGRLAMTAGLVLNSEGELYSGSFGDTGLSGPMQLDSVVGIRSMTKPITGAAAMQLVEQGKLDLDAPAGEVCPYLGEVQVLTGYDQNDQPTFRAPTSPVTLRNLMTHSSGFVYDVWNKDLQKYYAVTDTPPLRTRTVEALHVPLLFDPGTRWEYGISIDWIGQMVEAASGEGFGQYCQDHIFSPLGMNDTGFTPTPSMTKRMAVTHLRRDDGQLEVMEPGNSNDAQQPPPKLDMGGGGLFSTAQDYGRFLRMLLRGGELDGQRLLNPETVALMAEDHLGDISVGKLKSYVPMFSNDVEFFPGEDKGWGLTFQYSRVPGFTGRPSGTLMWAGLCNTYFWLDRKNDLAGLFVTQILPFADETSVETFYKLEKLSYEQFA